MKTHIVISALLLLLFSSQTALAKKIYSQPILPIEVAVEKAKQYVLEKKIDLGDAFIGVAEYHNMYIDLAPEYWRIRWVRKIGSKGGWFELRIYSDGSIEEIPGK